MKVETKQKIVEWVIAFFIAITLFFLLVVDYSYWWSKEIIGIILCILMMIPLFFSKVRTFMTKRWSILGLIGTISLFLILTRDYHFSSPGVPWLWFIYLSIAALLTFSKIRQVIKNFILSAKLFDTIFAIVLLCSLYIWCESDIMALERNRNTIWFGQYTTMVIAKTIFALLVAKCWSIIRK